MDHIQNSVAPSKISILIVDDSLVFRRFLRDIFEDCPDVLIVGEAQNGIEALDMILKTNPSVILLDLEMPIMDGMTALQHLMIHRPTPTIMFSSLTEEGTARSFDTMKNGAVDFICKNFIFQKDNMPAQKKVLINKVRKAAGFYVKAREPFFTVSPLLADLDEEVRRVVFCEDCGHREVISYKKTQPFGSVVCSQCGDSIEIGITDISRFRRNTFISVIGGGEGSFFNLLEIIPRLNPEMVGALIAVIHQETEQLNSFTEYLDAISAMKVVRAREGINIEGGNCYIASGHDYMHLKHSSAQLTLQRLQKASLNCGPLDILLASVSTLYKKRACGIILSGDENDGDKGMSILVKNGGIPIILDGDECYCKKMGNNILSKTAIVNTYQTEEILEKIKTLHSETKEGTVSE
ncbi:MAG: response regulator [Proteobacteria bacterium]|nr:response regulator [Pseudomonadota bacterium]